MLVSLATICFHEKYDFQIPGQTVGVAFQANIVSERKQNRCELIYVFLICLTLSARRDRRTSCGKVKTTIPIKRYDEGS